MKIAQLLRNDASFVSRNLTQSEWDHYLASLGAYHQSCAGNPPAP